MDEFTLVDADGRPIAISPTLGPAANEPVPADQFPNQTVVALKTTDFAD